MRFKNRKGSTLALTIMIFAVLMIFATFTLSFMVTENKQAMYHQNKTQAYYIAKSGAEITEAAITNHLMSLFDTAGVAGFNSYISALDNSNPHLVTLENDLGGIDTISVSIVDMDGNKVLAIDSKAIYKGVDETVRKLVWSKLITTTNIGQTVNYEGAPLVAIESAWRNDNNGLTDLSNPSLNNGKEYAEIVGENSVFKPISFDQYTIIWGEDLASEDIVLSDSVTLSADTQYNGNVKITGNLYVEDKVNIFIRGSLIIDGSSSINGGEDSDFKDLNFIIFNEDNEEIALSIDPAMTAEIKASFHVHHGKTLIDLKKAYLEGTIASNDVYTGATPPTNQNDYGVRISADDSSDKINFNGTIWAPDAYVIVGGDIYANDKSAILQDGMILGRHIEVEGLNHKKNFSYLDYILARAQDGITLPIPIDTESDVKVIEFESYFSK
jgi:hypothetical protein